MLAVSKRPIYAFMLLPSLLVTLSDCLRLYLILELIRTASHVLVGFFIKYKVTAVHQAPRYGVATKLGGPVQVRPASTTPS